MQIDVALTTEMAEASRTEGKRVVVIDTLRASSTMTTALSSGALRVEAVLEPGEALKRKQASPGVIIGGERGGRPIPGFDLGNSPLEYTPDKVGGREVVLTTTNGTRAMLLGKKAGELLSACLLNAPAVARRLSQSGDDVYIIACGAAGVFGLDDYVTAGALIDFLSSLGLTPDLTDSALGALEIYRAKRGNLKSFLSRCHHGKRLLRLGYDRDIDYCSRLGILDVVPVGVYKDGRLLFRPEDTL